MFSEVSALFAPAKGKREDSAYPVLDVLPLMCVIVPTEGTCPLRHRNLWAPPQVGWVSQNWGLVSREREEIRRKRQKKDFSDNNLVTQDQSWKHIL